MELNLSVTLEVNNVSIGNSSIVPLGDGEQTLNVSGQIKLGDKVLAGFYKNYPLSQEEKDSTVISGLEELAEAKIREDLGL